jgi:hypothetical protein
MLMNLLLNISNSNIHNVIKFEFFYFKYQKALVEAKIFRSSSKAQEEEMKAFEKRLKKKDKKEEGSEE